MTASAEWEQRADLLHEFLLDNAAGGPIVQHEGRDGLLWRGQREPILRQLWPDAQGQSRTHPYGGTLSRKLAGSVVKTGTEDGMPVWWIALDRTAPARDPRQCPTCGDRFGSVQARRGHQASHRHGPRRLWTDGDLGTLASALAPRLAPLLAAPGSTNGGTE